MGDSSPTNEGIRSVAVLNRKRSAALDERIEHVLAEANAALEDTADLVREFQELVGDFVPPPIDVESSSLPPPPTGARW